MTDAAAAARAWDAFQSRREAGPPTYVDWADHPTVLALLQETLFGDAQLSVFDFLRSRYPQFASARAISLCCGDGAFEKMLVQAGVFQSVVGTDISPARVNAANAARGPHAMQLEYRLHDANRGDYGIGQYDVVFAKAALHHIEKLEAAFDGIVRALRPDGRLVTIDFFGPTRFQWTDAQMAIANELLDAMPGELAMRPDGVRWRVTRPTVEAMIEMDPSEAVRAGELREILGERMAVEREFAVGGAVLNLVLDASIVNNFDPANEAHNGWIRRAFERERAAMEEGAIGSDFRFIVARPKP